MVELSLREDHSIYKDEHAFLYVLSMERDAFLQNNGTQYLFTSTHKHFKRTLPAEVHASSLPTAAQRNDDSQYNAYNTCVYHWVHCCRKALLAFVSNIAHNDSQRYFTYTSSANNVLYRT